MTRAIDRSARPSAALHVARLVFGASRAAVAGGLAAATFLAPASASAQTTSAPQTQPDSTIKTNTATTGTTDVAAGGFQSSSRPKDDDPKVATDVSIAAGGLFTAGNSRQIAATASGKARVRRDEHQVQVALAGNYAEGAKKGAGDVATVENLQGLLRYDYFFSDRVSLFLQSTARRDRFQGLDLRLNVDPGLAYYFIDTKKHRLQGEIGYDFQYDVRRDEALIVPPADDAPAGTPPTVLDKTQALHNARLFLGYENKLRKEVSLLASVEYLQNFADLDKYRFIFDIGLKSSVADNLALAATYTARYENVPLPNVDPLDSIASFTLVYSFF